MPQQPDQQPADPSAPSAPLDAAAILADLRAQVLARRKALTAAEAEQSSARTAIERQLQHSIEQLEITRVVSAHWPLEGHTLPQRALNFVHRVVRRYLRWYINPIVEQQNAFNDISARTLRLLAEGYSDLLDQLAETQATPPPPRSSPPHTPPRPPDVPATPATPDDGPPPTAALQAWVAAHGANEPPAAFHDIALHDALARLAQKQTVRAHWPLEEQTLVQRGAALIQKLTRFYLRWYINPIAEQQNGCNAAATEASTALLAADAEARARLAARRARRA